MRNSVVQYLVETTAKFPGKVAVEDNSGACSFSRLLSNACDISEAMATGHLINKPVAVYLPKSKEMITAFAAINLSGAFYVPLDTTSPTSRISKILQVLDCDCVITDNQHQEKLKEVWNGRIHIYEDAVKNSDCWQRAETMLSKRGIIDTDPVYSIFTSGSTGTPKGVVVTHRGVIDYIDWAVETFHIKEDTKIGNQAPFYFDNSTLDIYLMYATGATLNIIPEEKFAFPATLIDYLNQHEITFVFWVPFVLINIANFRLLDKKVPKTLRDVFFAGEVMPNKQLNYWRRHLPDCRYVNLYGPTEITVDCTYYEVNREFADDEPLPIGLPCRNTRILILKDRRTLCTAAGEQGEICVEGSSLAAGYYNNPEKTSDAFIQNPMVTAYPQRIYCTGDLGYWNEHGEVMFVGRADSQIKHKGYRIELGEIETAVLGTNLVKEGCVLYNHQKQRITLVYSNDVEIKPADLRHALNEKIPAYMLPSALVREETMRRNANGKIDRAFYNKQING